MIAGLTVAEAKLEATTPSRYEDLFLPYTSTEIAQLWGPLIEAKTPVVSGIGAGVLSVDVSLSYDGSGTSFVVDDAAVTAANVTTATDVRALGELATVVLASTATSGASTGRNLAGDMSGLQDRGLYAVGVTVVGETGLDSPHWVLVRGVQMRDLIAPAFTAVVADTASMTHDYLTDEFAVNVTVSLTE